jgi:hypothetical protein
VSAPEASAGRIASSAVPTVAHVERIAAHGDAVVRNLQITQCYHELSHALATRAGGAPANWCTFATWASKQAGQTIREEDLARAFERRFADSPEATHADERAAAAIQSAGAVPAAERVEVALRQARMPRSAFERASAAVARGNLKVFEEIGRAFAAFLALPAQAGGVAPDALAAFLGELRPGDPPDGQRYLRQAFSSYKEALSARDPKARAQLILLANLAIGWHEQVRLQPEIKEALDAPLAEPVKLRRDVLVESVRLRPSSAWRILWALVPGRASALKQLLDELDRHVKRVAHEAVTALLMTLALPGETLSLARDVPGAFPVELRTIDNRELLLLLSQVDPTPDTTRGSGARSWSDLHERVHFIADLFRVYQQRTDLHDAPFSAAQVALIKAGTRPAGDL